MQQVTLRKVFAKKEKNTTTSFVRMICFAQTWRRQHKVTNFLHHLQHCTTTISHCNTIIIILTTMGPLIITIALCNIISSEKKVNESEWQAQ